jgi:hypothetical protein
LADVARQPRRSDVELAVDDHRAADAGPHEDADRNDTRRARCRGGIPQKGPACTSLQTKTRAPVMSRTLVRKS